MNIKKTYFLAVYRAKEGGFFCKFPDWNIVDQGETLEETIENASKLLDFSAECHVEDNQELPVPSSGDDLKRKLDPEDGEVFCLVPVTVYPPAKTERINLTLKGDILARIDDYVKKKNWSRSKLMVNATLAYMQQA